MCNFCHIQGNNRNSIQHFDIDCFDKRNPNSRNFDPTTLSFQEQLQLATTNSIQQLRLEEERQLQQQMQRQRHLEEERQQQQQMQRHNHSLVHVVHPHPYLGIGQPVAIVNMGNGQGMVIPIGRIGIMNPRFRHF